MNAARLLAAFAAKADPDHVPAEVAGYRAPALLLDTLGVALAGVAQPGASAVREQCLDSGSAPQATLFGFDARVAVADAALANGTAAHALDFDDLQHPWYGHPTAVLFPAVFALAERRQVPGRQLVTAYLVGLAVGHALGAVLNKDHYARGWHATSTFGTIAAAAACANLLGLPESQTTHALGIAASFSSGIRQNFGTEVKPLHAGLAARGGVQAALLAAGGLTSSEEALDGPLGFAAVFNGQSIDVEQLGAALDDPFTAPINGIGVKRYPACGATHPGIDAALALAARHDLHAADVASIECAVDPLAQRILIYDEPVTPQQARFSLQHCVAAAIADRRVGLEQFYPDRVTDRTITSLVTRTTVVPDEGIDPAGDFATRVSVRTFNGDEYTEFVAQAKGKPDHPLGRDDILAKFLDCARARLDADTAAKVGDQLLHVFDAPDVADVAQTLRGGSVG